MNSEVSRLHLLVCQLCAGAATGGMLPRETGNMAELIWTKRYRCRRDLISPHATYAYKSQRRQLYNQCN
jgi:hypothetical protein